jgi:hypothetical protein
LSQGSAPSRRLTSRVEAPGDVWVYWQCSGSEDVLRVRDISLGGLFLETDKPRAPGMRAKLHFLIREGQIRAETAVRHSIPGIGVGLKFLAVCERDRPQFAALMSRLRGLSHSTPSSTQPQARPV